MQATPPSATDEQLGAIRVITDAYLGQLGVDDVLREITRRIAELLCVDTATVLLVDNSGQHLVARAAFGIEEEVRQGVRIGVGHGFAGAIAADGKPRILSQVDKTTVDNPLLWEKGLRVMMGVPLMSRDRVIGVLHVGSISERNFTEDEALSLQFVADRVASAVENRGVEMERVTAHVLQRSLLPTTLSHPDGFELATRYVPAELGGIGGDWYDAFTLPDGQLWIMVGDVGGHGLVPAVIMGRLRSSLRSYALEGHPPEDVLALADRKLQAFEPGRIATVLCAVLVPPYCSMRLASAGHLPPILAAPGEPARVVDLAPGMILGVSKDQEIETVDVQLPTGATVLAYTDGLVERRDRGLDIGIERLRTAVRADQPEVVCQDVMEAMVGRDVPSDDIAVVAFRKSLI